MPTSVAQEDHMNHLSTFVAITSLSIVALLAMVSTSRSQDVKLIKCGGHKTFVVAVAVSPEGKLVASGSDDRTLRIWRSADGKLLRTMPVADPLAKLGWVGAVAFAPDGKAVVANTTPYGLQFYNPATG